ncbi:MULTISPECIES: glutaminyl-peptide cyclotransferase [Weeksella]|uniref:Glutamine cyclotransferase n=1 Tax=Weeksella virosa (strain ATCC 43766 / DSM 16922 / JCM 21250 / CCUG 30538 / CDC 9751 / IAM 14551 / NBRC 16016 / NCTC 11634 / CL345/78) TaxID=865938 RepID=F0P0U5_WEEVC|nr:MULTISPECIES: glutaminyl-peptide cyclotransferase [Weeksella]ADX67509.1 glutamine cyclotransferase [Weeksella virosa DSM 16922]MDK7375275.1 glutaminyl-peptide cyclotransferase [Weeksella virosa]MDK7676009.1 glutaminyl-peptide cyclotransferase [Weeksella virosa]OFM84721.1 glutamine cyclotransferase [Weeksella sp. HMSC059D05]SUP53804.1 Glutamine cyclotransferase [Weeksella virosa]
MKRFYILFGLLVLSVTACKDDASVNNPLITQQVSAIEEKHYKIGDSLEITLEGLTNITEVKVEIDGKDFPNPGKITLENVGLGQHNVNVKFFNGSELTATREFNILVFADHPAQEWQYNLVNTYPHNPADFTQGFYYKDGFIFEGTGLTGQSRLVKYRLGSTTEELTGEVEKTSFGEGITELNGVIYQLTWQNRLIYEYDQNFELIRKITMPGEIREGWGITTMGQELVITDGSQKIHFFDKDFNYKRTIQAVDDKQAYSNLNELEYHNGLLYINIYQQNIIVAVDPASGAVVGKMNLEAFKAEQAADADVLNGIAFKGENMLVTGKLWNKIYEVSIKR